jgi:hypothetical protein
MSDLLSASSLYLAVLGLLHSAWYGDISRALAAKVSEFKEHRGDVIRQTRDSFRTKAFPLALGSCVLSVILLPDAVGITLSSLKLFFKQYPSAFASYSAVNTLFVAIALSTVMLAAHLITLTVRLWHRYKDISR